MVVEAMLQVAWLPHWRSFTTRFFCHPSRRWTCRCVGTCSVGSTRRYVFWGAERVRYSSGTQDGVARLCEAWWHASLPRKEEVIPKTVPFVLLHALRCGFVNVWHCPHKTFSHTTPYPCVCLFPCAQHWQGGGCQALPRPPRRSGAVRLR